MDIVIKCRKIESWSFTMDLNSSNVDFSSWLAIQLHFLGWEIRVLGDFVNLLQLSEWIHILSSVLGLSFS